MVGNDTIHTVTRKEHDCIGYMDVPKDVYWGIHTQRALGNFTVSRIADSTHPQLMRAYATVKRACAEANDELDRVRRDDSEAAGKLADAKVRLAQTSERLRSLKGRRARPGASSGGIDRRIRGTRQASRSLELLRLRVDPMHERYSALLERASDWAARLRDQASLEEADSASLKKTIEDAKPRLLVPRSGSMPPRRRKMSSRSPAASSRCR